MNAKEILAVLERVENDGCGCSKIVIDVDGKGTRFSWCPEQFPEKRDDWCWCCQIREVLPFLRTALNELTITRSILQAIAKGKRSTGVTIEVDPSALDKLEPYRHVRI